MTVRVGLFVDREDCILFVVPEGEQLGLAAVTAPFNKSTVGAALRAAGTEYSVFEQTTVGRWLPAVQRAERDASTARAQQEYQKNATEATLLRGSNIPLMRERGEVILRKQDVDARARALKGKIGKAKSAAFEGRYLPPKEFRSMESELERLKQESQTLQTRLGEIREEEKRTNAEEAKAQPSSPLDEERVKPGRMSWSAACRRVLTEEQFRAVKAMRDSAEED